jgi:hypothetical protein
MGIMPWIIGLVVVGGLGYYFLGDRMRSASVTSPAAIMHNGINISAELNKSVDSLKSALGAIRDEASARAAVPGMEAARKGLDTIADLAGKMGAPEKKSLSGLATPIIAALRPLIDTALKNAGPAAGVIKPVIDSALAKLETLAKG